MKPPNRGVADTNVFPAGRQAMGPLESKVLDLLWDQDRAVTVRHVHLAFPELAYTTLMTTLDRLYRKGILVRRRRGRAFAYEPRCSRDELLSNRLSSDVTDLLAATGASTAILSTLVRAVGRKDVALLDELDVLIEAERTRLKMGDP
jgi:predicted transcriptional regulator